MAAHERRRAAAAQERMLRLAHERRDHDVSVVVWEVRGPLDRRRWEAAVAALALRHAPLRTRLVEHADGIWQEIADDLSIEVMWEASRRPADADVAAAIGERLAVEPFLLSAAPLARTVVVEGPDGVHLAVWAFSHAIWDAFSAQVLLHDFALLYGGEELPPLRQTYADLVMREPARALRPPLPGAAEDRYHGVTVAAGRLAGDAVAALRARARAAGAPIAVALAALLTAAVGGSGDDDDGQMVLGLLDAGRHDAARRALIGCLVEVRFLRAATTPEQPLGELLGSVRDAFADAYDTPVPFERMPPRAVAGGTLRAGVVADGLLNFQPPGIRDDGVPVVAGALELSARTWVPLRRELRARGPWTGAPVCLAATAADRGALDLWLTYDAELLDPPAAAAAITRVHELAATAAETTAGRPGA